MRKVRYSIAMSLDGFIAGPAGEVDWLPHDLECDLSLTRVTELGRGVVMMEFDVASVAPVG